MNNVTVSEVPADAQIIDVREPSEYAQGHAQGAINIPLGSVVERSGELDTSRDVYVICQLGGRSAKAAKALESHLKPQSFTIHNISGGTEAWIYRIVALSHCRTSAFCPLPHRQPHKHQKPHESQKPAKSSSCVLRYCLFWAQIHHLARDIAAHNPGPGQDYTGFTACMGVYG